MYSFTYHRPSTVRQAANLLAKNEDAKLLAGGHSLIPVMKLRLARPTAIIDISRVEGLSGIELKGRSIVIGALTRHGDVANSAVVQENIPALASVPASIGDPQVRNVGTIGGAIANNDPTRIIPPPASVSAQPSSPTSGASRRTNSSLACSRPRLRQTRSSPRCSSRS